MKNITLCVLSALAISCGNPHINSVKKNVEQIVSPIENTCNAETLEQNFKFIFAESETEYPAEFQNFMKCRTNVTETFVSFTDGIRPSVTGSGEGISYTLLHRVEVAHMPEKVDYLDDIFAPQNYDLEIESPLVLNGVQGSDRGVDSGDAEVNSIDGLIWSFSAPVAYVGLNLVGVESGSVAQPTLRVFNCNRRLIKEVKLKAYAQDQGQFVGVLSAKSNICHLSLSAASETEALAVDRFTYGL